MYKWKFVVKDGTGKVMQLEKRGTNKPEIEVYLNDTFKEYVPIKISLINKEIRRLELERDALYIF